MARNIGAGSVNNMGEIHAWEKRLHELLAELPLHE